VGIASIRRLSRPSGRIETQDASGSTGNPLSLDTSLRSYSAGAGFVLPQLFDKIPLAEYGIGSDIVHTLCPCKMPRRLRSLADILYRTFHVNGLLWMPLQDKRQVDLIARYARDSPGDTEITGCSLRVVVRSAIVAVLDGQDIGSTVGADMAGEKINLTDVRFPIMRDRVTLPPPLRFVIAPHLQDSLGHLHIWMGRGERELAPIQVSCPALRFLAAVLIQQTKGSAIAIAGQGSPRGSVPGIPPNL